MLIQYNVRIDDAVALNKHLFTIPGRNRRIVWGSVIFGGGAGFLAAQILVRNPATEPVEIIINFLLAAGMALLILPCIKFFIIWSVKRNQPEKGLGGTVIELGPAGICRNSNQGEILYPWREVIRFTSDGDRYFVHLQGNKFVVVRKENLKAEHEFVDFIERHARIWKRETVPAPTRNTIIKAVALLLSSLFLWGYYTLLPSYQMDTAMRTTNNLFIGTDSMDPRWPKLKKTTSQENIDAAGKALRKINTSSRRYAKYMPDVLRVSLQLSDAQRQLDDREGKVAPIPPTPKEEPEPEPEQQEKKITVNPEDSTLISLLRNFPSLEKSWHDVPYGLKQYVMVPSLNSLPFTEMRAGIDMEYKDMVSIYFFSRERTVRTSFWKPEMVEEEGGAERDVQLEEGITGYVNEAERKLYFHDPVPDSPIRYGVWIGDNDSFDVAAAIEIANSMIREGKVSESDFNPNLAQ